jgi:hypothetical protein
LKSPDVYEPNPTKRRPKFTNETLFRAFENIEKRAKAKAKEEAYKKKVQARQERALQKALAGGKSSPTHSDFSDASDSEEEEGRDPTYEAEGEDVGEEEEEENYEEEGRDDLVREEAFRDPGAGSQIASSQVAGSKTPDEKKRSRNKGTPSRKRTSPIWLHFQEDPADPLFVVCKYVDNKTKLECRARIKRTDQSTSGLLKHLKQHKKAYAEFLKAKADQVR